MSNPQYRCIKILSRNGTLHIYIMIMICADLSLPSAMRPTSDRDRSRVPARHILILPHGLQVEANPTDLPAVERRGRTRWQNNKIAGRKVHIPKTCNTRDKGVLAGSDTQCPSRSNVPKSKPQCVYNRAPAGFTPRVIRG